MTVMNPVMGPAIIQTTAGADGNRIDPDVELWAGAVRSNGGTVSGDRLRVLHAFVSAEKAAGSWNLTDDYWGFWAENAEQALTSLKQRRLVTAVNSPTFTADRGYVFNGSSNYLDTGFIPSSHNIAASGANQRIGAYERTSVSTNSTITAGSGAGTTRALAIANYRTTEAGMVGRTNSAGVAFAVSNSLRLKVVSRGGGGTTARGYDAGVRLTDATGLTVNNTAPEYAIYVGAINSSGVAGSFRAASVGYLVVGAPLPTDEMEAAHWNNVQAWAAAVGAQV